MRMGHSKNDGDNDGRSQGFNHKRLSRGDARMMNVLAKTMGRPDGRFVIGGRGFQIGRSPNDPMGLFDSVQAIVKHGQIDQGGESGPKYLRHGMGQKLPIPGNRGTIIAMGRGQGSNEKKGQGNGRIQGGAGNGGRHFNAQGYGHGSNTGRGRQGNVVMGFAQGDRGRHGGPGTQTDNDKGSHTFRHATPTEGRGLPVS